ncbi:MAG: cytochrome c biogenesis protein ResB [Bacillota bacterium]
MALDRCPDCNATLPEEARYCPACGVPVAPDAPLRRRREEPSPWVQFLDAAWDFFASVRVAVVLIVLIALAAIAGTLVEQEGLYQDWRPPELYYPARYGPLLGRLLMATGLTRTYTSWWFLTLVYLLVISLIVCSLQRLVPLHRALQRPTVEKHLGFLLRQPVQARLPAQGEDPLAPLAETLRRRGYRVWREGKGLHADRGRLGRYGPYVIHIGLIICALAAGAKALPGVDVTHDLWIENGQTVALPGTRLAIRNNRFTMETYPNGMPRLFQTQATLLEDGREVLHHNIEVNKPLVYGPWWGPWEIYQASWREEPGIAHLELVTGDRVLGKVDLDLKSPAREYPVTPEVRVVVERYFHDFELDPATGQPVNRSREIANPVFLLRFVGPDGQELGRQALNVAIQPGVEARSVAEGPYALRQVGISSRWYTGLRARRDLTVPYMYGGLGVVMVGMYITFFIFHRQIWALDLGTEVVLGARTNKDRWGLQQEVRRIARALGGELTVGSGVERSPGSAGAEGAR